jgi:predicted Zn-dependent peptidase
MNDGVLAIGIHEAKAAIQDPVDLKDALAMSMKAMKQFWLSTDDNVRFRAALGGVMQYYGQDSQEFEQLEWEIKQMKKLNAFLAAAQSGLEVKVPEIDETRKVIGIMAMWHETKV